MNVQPREKKIEIDETIELDPEKDYPFRASLVNKKAAMCGMCKGFTGIEQGMNCKSGHEPVGPFLAKKHDCKDYSYNPHVITLLPAGKIMTFMGLEGARPECKSCANQLYGYCHGMRWHPITIKAGMCEFYRDAGLTCKHAVPHMQYGSTDRNNYCSRPPAERDENVMPYFLEITWECCCTSANDATAVNYMCYEPKDPAFEQGVQALRQKREHDARPRDDLRAHVKVGEFYLSPFGPSDYYLDLGGWLLHIDDSTTAAILTKLGVAIASTGWASWENEHWRVEGNDVVFDITVGTATRHPKRYTKTIPSTIVKETLLQGVCKHKSTDGSIVLKNCRLCCYADQDGQPQCLFSFTSIDPVKLVAGRPREFIGTGCSRHDSSAWMSFKVNSPEEWIPTKWDRLFKGMRTTRSQTDERTLVRYYSFNESLQHSLTFKKADNRVDVWARNTNDVLTIFAEACYHVGGDLEPIPHTSRFPEVEMDVDDDYDYDDESEVEEY
jgi:hypothetical protein